MPKGKGPMSSLTKAALGRSLMSMNDLNIDSIKSELVQIRDRVNALIETLDKAVAKTDEEDKKEEAPPGTEANDGVQNEESQQQQQVVEEAAPEAVPAAAEVVVGTQEEYAMAS